MSDSRFVVTLDANKFGDPTEEEYRRFEAVISSRLNEQDNRPLILPPGVSVRRLDDLSSEMKALCRVLELGDNDRSFLRAVTRAPEDKEIWLIVADWLEERGREREAARMRSINAQG